MRRSSSLLFLLLLAACGHLTASDATNGGSGGADGGSSAADPATAGNSGSAGSMIPPSSGSAGSFGGHQGGGTAGAFAMGGASSAGQASLGGASDVAPEAGSNAGGGAPPSELHNPRSGPFKMVVYSKTQQYRHEGAIASGTLMLQQIAVRVGAEVLFTEDKSFIESLDDYELLFFLNPSGNSFSADEKAKLEAWMLNGGAFCGTHSAAETEYGWPFYLQVIGQNDEGHGYAGTRDSLVLEETALGHPALGGLSNPWERVDEWLLFKSQERWRHMPGFKILARKASDGLPISWIREHGGFRSFYTGLGHDASVFEDPQVRQHLTGGIMWTVRREHCLATPKPAGCP